jgi:uncharacterized protein YjbI with pentapeptide repeats
MANEEHLAILKKGAKAWNKWREENPAVRPDLLSADLSDRNLFLADLRRANLCDVNLVGADLGLANLTGANLGGANLAAATLAGATLEMTILADVDLSEVEGLDGVHHIGPSTVGIDTIYKSKGKIPEVFLRGCGVPESMITFMHSLVGTAIEFYSCFISYSSKDNDFAKRVYADLQSKGVRVWFAPEDLKIGDKFRSRIDEAIRIYDKLLLVLSENSINSEWVEDEVEAALEKEHAQNRTMLFPVRLDDAVMKTDQAWAASIRRTRHIGDMSAWKDHDRYQTTFDRLLRDLKASEAK